MAAALAANVQTKRWCTMSRLRACHARTAQAPFLLPPGTGAGAAAAAATRPLVLFSSDRMAFQMRPATTAGRPQGRAAPHWCSAHAMEHVACSMAPGSHCPHGRGTLRPASAAAASLHSCHTCRICEHDSPTWRHQGEVEQVGRQPEAPASSIAAGRGGGRQLPLKVQGHGPSCCTAHVPRPSAPLAACAPHVGRKACCTFCTACRGCRPSSSPI